MIKARPVGRRHRGGRRVSSRSSALCLAQISRLRGDCRRPFDQAPDPCPQGPRRDRRQGPQRQARPRRHPRDRVLRPDPAADRRRPFPEAARPRDCGMLAELAERGWITPQARDGADPPILVPAPVEHAHPDGRRRADPHAAGRRGGAGAHRAHARLSPAQRFLEREFPRLLRGEKHYAALFETAPNCRPASAISSSPATSTIPIRCRRCPISASSGRATSAACHPHLAFRPLPRDAVGRGARAADRTDAGAAAGLRRHQAGRRGADALRQFIPGLPAGIQLFSLLQSNPPLLKLIATIMGAAPRLGADHHAPAACFRRPARSRADVSELPTAPICRQR
jgi:hypothetical protein